MKLIADSGSTKADWRLIHQDQTVEHFSTIGFNPFFIDSTDVLNGMQKSFPARLDPAQVRELYFYGAGCSTPTKCAVVSEGLRKIFTQAKIEVQSDLLAAARGLFHNEAGLVAIIGTGSNTCLFDGTSIIKKSSALGYILGDEGSGAYLGTQLIRDYLNSELPPPIHQKFYDEYKILKDDVLDRVYCAKLPNRFLASFTEFLSANLNEPALFKIVYEGFVDLFDKHLCKYDGYQQHKIRCVGSVAHHFEGVLKQVAHDKGAVIDRVLEFPIDELVKFHLRK